MHCSIIPCSCQPCVTWRRLHGLHELQRNRGYLVYLDTSEAIQGFKALGRFIIFSSYLWLSSGLSAYFVVPLDCFSTFSGTVALRRRPVATLYAFPGMQSFCKLGTFSTCAWSSSSYHLAPRRCHLRRYVALEADQSAFQQYKLD